MEFLSDNLQEKVDELREALLDEVSDKIRDKVESYENAPVVAYKLDDEEHKIQWGTDCDELLACTNEAFLTLLKYQLTGADYAVLIKGDILCDIILSGLFDGLVVKSIRVPKIEKESDSNDELDKIFLGFEVDPTENTAFVKYWNYMTGGALENMRRESLVLIVPGDKSMTKATQTAILDTLLLVHAMGTDSDPDANNDDIELFPAARAESVLYTLELLKDLLDFDYRLFTLPEVAVEAIKLTYGEEEAQGVTPETLGKKIVCNVPNTEEELLALKSNYGIAVEFWV